jgi:hypothetical protein
MLRYNVTDSSSKHLRFSMNKNLGFTEFAESWNGRLAMLGLAIGFATELLTGQGILAQLGLM